MKEKACSWEKITYFLLFVLGRRFLAGGKSEIGREKEEEKKSDDSLSCCVSYVHAVLHSSRRQGYHRPIISSSHRPSLISKPEIRRARTDSMATAEMAKKQSTS